MKFKKPRQFIVEIIVENESGLAQGLQDAQKTIEDLGLKVHKVREVDDLRSLQQNKSLHKWCKMMADELTEKHIDKREFFKEPFFLSWTMEGVKNDVWRPIQKSLTGKKSTTKLNKNTEINLIWDNINKIIIDKYNGNVQTPEFPSEERMMEEDIDNQY